VVEEVEEGVGVLRPVEVSLEPDLPGKLAPPEAEPREACVWSLREDDWLILANGCSGGVE